MPKALSKEERLRAVADVVVRMIVARRDDSISVSNVSRRVKTSRAWLYKYIGRTRKELIDNALSFLEHEFTERFNRSVVTDSATLRASLLDGNRVLLADVTRNPAIVHLYTASLLFHTPWAVRVRKAEAAYLREVLAPEIERGLKLSRSAALALAETLTMMRMAVMQRWILPQRAEPMDEKRALAILDQVVEMLSAETAAGRRRSRSRSA